jgi:hypothetical protein
VNHVGIATGDGTLMVNAPHRGALVRIQDAASRSGYLAAARPSNRT